MRYRPISQIYVKVIITNAALSLRRGSRQPELLGEADALQLAGGALGDFGEEARSCAAP